MDDETIKKRRDELNSKQFPSEKWFKGVLDSHGIGAYRRNVCLEKRYFGDFVFRSIRLVVEIDGSSHIGKEDYDFRRDQFLRSRGWRVERIPVRDKKRTEEVLEILKDLVGLKAKTKEAAVRKIQKNKKQKKILRFSTKKAKQKTQRRIELDAYLAKRPKKKGLILSHPNNN